MIHQNWETVHSSTPQHSITSICTLTEVGTNFTMWLISGVIHGSHPQQGQSLPQLNQTVKPARVKAWYQFKFPLFMDFKYARLTSLPLHLQGFYNLNLTPRIESVEHSTISQERPSWSQLHLQGSYLISSHFILSTVFPIIHKQNSHIQHNSSEIWVYQRTSLSSETAC